LAENIPEIAAASAIAAYEWNNRGQAPVGYIQGMALTYAQVYRNYLAGDSSAHVMAQANTGNDETDAISWYNSRFVAHNMSNAVSGVDTLRHLWVLLLGLGMRESSGQYCCGWDREESRDELTADSAEAGLFQMSWNAHIASPELPKLFASYSANPTAGYLASFKEGVQCSTADFETYGAGPGADFQKLAKYCPALAAQMAAVGLRTIRNHWGPINRHEAEIRLEANSLFLAVQKVVDAEPPAVAKINEGGRVFDAYDEI
jgi:hypothetical protein